MSAQDLNAQNIEKSLEKTNSADYRKEKLIIATSNKVSSKRMSNLQQMQIVSQRNKALQ